MRGLKAMVIGMGFLIILGVIFLIYAIVQKSGDGLENGVGSERPPTVSSLVLPAGAKVDETIVGVDRIVIRLSLPNGSGRLLILNAVNGRLVSQTDLTFE